MLVILLAAALASTGQSGNVRLVANRPQGVTQSNPESAIMQRVLSKADQDLLKSYRDASQADIIEGYKVTNKCKPHECPSSNATVIASPDGEQIWVAFFERRGDVWSTRWFGNTDYVNLPAAVQAEVRFGHESKP